MRFGRKTEVKTKPAEIEFEPVIYAIYNMREAKYYVGKTFKQVTKRWLVHMRGSHDTGIKFRAAFFNSPITDWAFIVLEEIEIPENIFLRSEIENYMTQRECYWIIMKNSIDNGYNTIFPSERNIPKDYSYEKN